MTETSLDDFRCEVNCIMTRSDIRFVITERCCALSYGQRPHLTASVKSRAVSSAQLREKRDSFRTFDWGSFAQSPSLITLTKAA